MRVIFTLLVFILFASTTQAEALRIGLIAPLTGKASNIGNYVKNGVQLALEENKSEELQVELFVEDAAWEIPKSVSAAQRLIALKDVHALIVVGSAVGNAVSQIAEKNNVVLIAVGASDDKVSTNKTFSFTHWVTPETESQVLADELKKRNYKKLALVSSEQEGVIALLNVFKEEMKTSGIEGRLVLEKSFLMDNQDFRTFISKAKAEEVDAVIVCLLSGGIAAFAKQARSFGLDVPLVGIEMFEDEHEVKASEGTLIDQWYVNADDSLGDFQKRYKKAYNEHPGWGSANAYDSTALLIEAANKKALDTKKIANYLSTVKNYQGVAGEYSATGDNRFTLPAAIKVVKKDGFKKLY